MPFWENECSCLLTVFSTDPFRFCRKQTCQVCRTEQRVLEPGIIPGPGDQQYLVTVHWFSLLECLVDCGGKRSPTIDNLEIPSGLQGVAVWP